MPGPAFNPFPGLRPFEPDEDHLFFGREKEIDELLRRLRATRFLSVVGTSGSGKSSLVRSGLIPALYSGSMVTAGSSWRVAVLRPGEDPIGNLAAALSVSAVLGTDPQVQGTAAVLLEATLRRSTRGLAEAVRLARIPAHDNLLVVVDQFEELFRFRRNRRIDNSRDDAIAFVKLLLEAAAQTQLPVYIVLTMRSDFIGDCMEYPGLSEAVNSGQYLVPRMQRDALRLAITGPVAVAGGAIAPRLVLRLLNEIGDDVDQLPLLQHSLMRSWDRWAHSGERDVPLDIADYEDVGTLRQALSLHAEETFAETGTDRSRQITERLFKALTDTSSDSRGVRRPTAISELAAVCEAAETEVMAIVELFRLPGRSFLMPPAAVALKSASVVDLSHESLMRCWDRLVRWTEEERTAAAFYVRLSQAAAWHAQGSGRLWAEPELDLALQWKAQNRPTEAWARRYNEVFPSAVAFLERSVIERDRVQAEREHSRRRTLRRARAAAAIFGGLSLVAVSFAVLAYRQNQRAETNLRLATSAVEQTLLSADVNPAHAGADVPALIEFRRALLEKTKRFYVEFLAGNPSTPALQAEMAFARFRLGHISRMLERPEEAAAEYQQAIDGFSLVDREHPSPEYKQALANAYNWLGETLRPVPGRVDAARTAYDNALRLQAALVAGDPARAEYRQELARTHYNRGILREAASGPGNADRRAAESDFREAARLLELLAQSGNPGTSRHELARVYNNLATLIANDDTSADDRARLTEAGNFYLRAIDIDERLLTGDPANRLYKFELAKFNNNAAELHRRQQDVPRALERSRTALRLLEDLARPAPSLTIELADANQLLGLVLESSRAEDPTVAYEQALQLFETLGRDPVAVRLALFHQRFNELLLTLADRSNEDPGSRRLLRRALDYYLGLADSSLARGDRGQADMIFDTVRRLLPDLDGEDRRAVVSRRPRLQEPMPTHK
jgi:tetratricopeptide (TPR) repeat protein